MNPETKAKRVGDKTCRANFARLHEGILHAKFHPVTEDDAAYVAGIGLSYKEQLESL